MTDPAGVDAVVDSLPDAVTSWRMHDDWRQAADVFLRRLEGQGYQIVPLAAAGQ